VLEDSVRNTTSTIDPVVVQVTHQL